MNDPIRAALLIAVMALVTAATRFLPFWLLGDQGETPPFLRYLGRVLPYAIMGMLVVYCLKDVSPAELSSFLPAAAGVTVTAGLHLWKHNTLLSIIGGTACYMILVQMVF